LRTSRTVISLKPALRSAAQLSPADRCEKNSAWSIEYDPAALQDLKKLDRAVQHEIVDYMDDRVARARSPRDFGKPLRGSKFGLWRYRVRDYRVICELQERRLVVLVVAVGHRSIVYDD
jgi:mRNA interferase RelE/StbE